MTLPAHATAPRALGAAAVPPCPLCGSGGAVVTIRKFDLEMADCPDCGLVFTTAPPEHGELRYEGEWFEKEYLPSFGVDPKNPSTAHLGPRFDGDLDLIERHVRKGRLLDVGAGAGLLLERARARGWDVAGVEPAAYGAEYARRVFGLPVHHGTLAGAPLREGSFDAVVLQDVIEHVADPGGLMGEVRRVLRPGGAVLLTTPNYGALSRLLFRSNWALISPAEHLSLFRTKTVEKLLADHALTPALLRSTDEVSAARYHFDAQRGLGLRRRAVSAAAALPPALLRPGRLGDELVVVALAGR